MKKRYVLLNFVVVFAVLYVFFAHEGLLPYKVTVAIAFIAFSVNALNLVVLWFWIDRERIVFLTRDTVLNVVKELK